MKSFQFPLQKALDWRALQMRAEEDKLTAMQREQASLLQRDQALAAAQTRSEAGVLRSSFVDGADIRALAAFRLRIQSERNAIHATRQQVDAQILLQRKRLLKARKDVKVLERLKEKRLKTWQYLSDREVEQTAADNYMAQWIQTALEPESGGGPA